MVEILTGSARRRRNPAPSRVKLRVLRAAWLLWLVSAFAAAGPLSAQTPEKPRLRWEFLNEKRAYPFATVPPGAYQRAVAEAQRIWPGQLGPAAQRTPSGPVWRAIGPENIPGLAIVSTGRLSTVALHPTDPNVIYIGAAQGGVWRSMDGGITWVPLTDDECSLAMGALAIDPVSPNIIYAGTGEQHFSADSYYGCGVLRSADGGATWTRLGAETFATPTGGATISRVLIDPATAGTLGATTLYVSSDFGVYKSTDGGVTWHRMLGGVATDLVMDPSDRLVLYAALGRVTTDPANGVYKSSDGGESWTRLSNGFPSAEVGRINLAIAPSEPQTLYASVQNDFGGSGTDGSLLGIWKTVDGGVTWAQLPATGAACGTQCWYDKVLAVHPHAADTVYFGGVFLYKSSDGGQTFPTIGGQIHVDQHAIVIDPRNPSTVYVGNDGGIYRSINGGQSWTSLNTNLAVTQFYGGVSFHPTDPDRLLGGTQDNGTLRWNGTPSWEHVLGGDGGFTAIDYQNPTTSYAETQWSVNSGFSGPRRSDNDGPYVLKTNGIATSDRALFIPPLVMDPVDPTVLYFGTFRLYRTANRGESWSIVSPDLTAGGRGISAIAIAPSNTQVLYVGTSSGRLHRTANRGVTWTDVTAGLPNRYLTSIAVSATDPQTAYVTFGGFLAPHVFRTVNGGASWTNISANLPDLPVNAVALDPVVPGGIYIGTDLGVFRSMDDGTSWAPYNEGFPNVAVFDLTVNAATGHLVAATHGRGMFRATIGAGVLTVRGTVRYALGDGLPVPGVTIAGSGGALGQPVTDGTGAFTATVVAGESATFTPTRVGGRGEAVSALDAAWVLQCAAGTRICDGHLARAGDVHGDGAVTPDDAAAILEILVGSRATFPAGDWVFEPPAREYAALSTSLTDQDFTAVLIGDLTGNWTPASGLTVARSTAGRAPDGGMRIAGHAPGSRLAASPGVLRLVQPRAEQGGDIVLAIEARPVAGPLHAVEVEVGLPPGDGFDVVGVDRAPAAAAASFLLAHRVDAGSRAVRIAMASADGLEQGGTLVLIRLRPRTGTAGGAEFRIRSARIDEVPVDLDDDVARVTEIPVAFSLEQNVPNPFNGASGTRFDVHVPIGPGGFGPEPVRIQVYTLRGALVRTLLDDPLEPGLHSVTWDGRDRAGRWVSSGVYIVVAENRGARSRVRVIFVR